MEEKRNIGLIQRKKEYPESYDEYLEIIYRISLTNPKGWVKNKDIADRLSVKPPSVSNMLSKLKETKLIEWKPRGGIRLSEKGRDRAKQLIKNHIVLELFLSRILDLQDQEEIERITCNLEHYITPEVKKKIMKMMGIDINEINNIDNLILEDKFPDFIETKMIYKEEEITRFAQNICSELEAGNVEKIIESLKSSIKNNDYSKLIND